VTRVRPRSNRSRRIVTSVLLLLGVAVLLFGVLYAIDFYVGGGRASGYFSYDDNKITDAVGSLSGLFAAVLGIIITVVSIIVQLSADRYSNVTQMFFSDRINVSVLGFYVFACICGVLNSFSIHANWVPRITLTAMILMAAVSFAVMAPYFAYVFDFLQPENIIARIRTSALASALAGGRATSAGALGEAQRKTLHSMEEITDIIINSIGGKDKMIATGGVDALKDFAVRYIAEKQAAAAAWFAVGPGIRKNPDFVSLAPESVDDMERRRTWVEWKILRQYQAIYHEALAQMKDVACVIAIDTRYIGEEAVAAGDKEALAVCVKFFNSFLRATLNARDVRTAYNTLHQYRGLTEGLLRSGWHDKVTEVAGYIKYYAHVSFGMGLGFVTETCAYDLCRLCEIAHDLASPDETQLLEIFLEVDQPSAEEDKETGLRGVRKAQAKLATHYLVTGDQARARLIFEDMKHERPERLRSIRDELLEVKSEDFWEVVDRGTNFDYLPPERKQALRVFFDWFPRLGGEVVRDASKEAKS
jgi:roadblock/LC7 domain-containing protein